MPVTTFHPDELAAAYDYIRVTPPFKRWKLPESDALAFRVSRHNDRFGHFDDHDGKKPFPTIAISTVHTKSYRDLVAVLCHEIIHVKLKMDGYRGWDRHGYEFKRLSRQVCRIHDFDFATFI